MVKNSKKKIILKLTVFKIISFLNQIIPKNNNLILLYSANNGLEFNLVPLRDYLISNNYIRKYKIYCGVEDLTCKKNDGCDYISKFKSIFIYLIAKNVFYTTGQLPIKPSKNQNVIQLHHGITFKTIKSSSNSKFDDSFYFTKCCITSSYFTEIYKGNYNCSDENIFVNSEPITDVFFNNKSYYSIGDYKKTIFWAPTFRQSKYLGYNDSSAYFIPDFNSEDFIVLNDILNKLNYLLVIKLHPSQDIDYSLKFIYSNLKIYTNDNFNDRGYELYRFLRQTDILISDFSSLYLQYLLLNKPIAFYVPDIDEYLKTRGSVFNSPLDYMPGHIIYNKEQLVNYFNNIDMYNEKYSTAREEIKNIVHKYQDGNSCKRILDCVGII